MFYNQHFNCVCPCVSQRVMDEAYKLIDRIYIKCLLQRSHSKLKKSWSPDIAETITEDAKLLMNTITNLVRAVDQ